MSNLSTFVFKESDVRVLNIDNYPWFVAKDLCLILELSDVSMSLKRLDDDEKLTQTLFVSGQNRDMSVVSESGMYSLVLTSRKPQAKAFKKWITSEVLPSIRKTGKYETQPVLESKPRYEVGSVQDHIEGLELLFNKMNISPQYLPSILAEGVKEAHPQLAGTAEQMKILMATNAENDIGVQSFTVTEIGEMLPIKISAVKLNKILESMGYQEKVNKRWVLTEEGKENGGVVIATTQKGRTNNVEQIRWQECIVNHINDYLES